MTDMDGADAQDTAEVLDETNLTDDGGDFVTFEEIQDDHVRDLTQLIGDADDQAGEALDEDEFDEDAIDDEDLESDEDSPGEADDSLDDDTEFDEDLGDDADEVDGVAALGDDEVELEYAGDMTDLEHARGSAKPFEAIRELDDDDLEELGYQDAEGRTR